VDLVDIRLSEIAAHGTPGPGAGHLVPAVEHTCTPTRLDRLIEVSCAYRFTATAAESAVAEAKLTYLILYSLDGEDPVTDSDLQQFAFANGTYHSWPFVRQALHDLTAKMGLPPFVLPVFQFNPQPPKSAASSPNPPNKPEAISENPIE
jgi:hypothetical protein